MKSVHNIVFAKHDGKSKRYLFELPIGAKAKKHDVMRVCTKKGEANATCVCDSFIVDDHALRHIADACGAYLPLAKAIGKMVKVMNERVYPFKCEEDDPGLPF